MRINMIIKAYTNNFPEEIYLIEGASDVVVHQNLFSGPQCGPDRPIITTFRYIDNASPDEPDTFKIIDYTQNSIGTRLVIRNRAYVCNDEGKTIEKVSAK